MTYAKPSFKKILEEVRAESRGHSVGNVPCGCYAVWMDINQIKTDPRRFQNRTDAFSELSAEAVAVHFDPNKFDPIVVWNDPEDGKTYVLSGHSRYEGMRRRKEPKIPARFFKGTEAEAVTFARVDANRAAAAENLIEDLKAYTLMRDGDQSKGLSPAPKKNIDLSFKGKTNKLEAWSHLNPNGFFIQFLKEDNRSEYPHIENRAMWVGQLRKNHPEMTNTHEDDCFRFFYYGQGNLKLSKDEFFKEAEKRLAWGKERLFPECGDSGCVDLQDLSERGRNAEAYKELNRLTSDLQTLGQRLGTSSTSMRVYTNEERLAIRSVAQKLAKEIENIKERLEIVEAEPGLFGIGIPIDFDWNNGNLNKKSILERNLTPEELESVFHDPDKFIFEQRNAGIEFRHTVIGMSNKNRILAVVYTHRDNGKVRIISAWQVSRKSKEAKTYLERRN